MKRKKVPGNLRSIKTPGINIKEISTLPPSVAEVETAIPAFIGHTEKADKVNKNDLLRVPTRIGSMQDYKTYFGSYRPQEISVSIDSDNLPSKATIVNPSYFKMYYAVQAYFDNGGGYCYIVSVGNYSDTISLNQLGRSNSPIKGGLDLIEQVDEVTLILFPDAHGLSGPNYYLLHKKALEQCGQLHDRFTLIDVKRDDESFNDPIVYLRGVNGIGNTNLKYGAVYWPWIKMRMNWEYSNESITFDHAPNRILHHVTLAEAIENGSMAHLITDDFIERMNLEINKNYIEMAPGSAIAGIYAKLDESRGVWKAPANTNLNNVIEPLINISNQEQESLNFHPSGKSINCIRSFTGKGILVWGARTLAGNDNEWRYIPVCRFFNMVEESIKKSTQWVVFEPNDANLWTKVKSMIENYLFEKWTDGALVGSKPEDAYFVKVGLGQTMTSKDIMEGKLIVEIGMALVRPGEYVLMRFSKKMQGV